MTKIFIDGSAGTTGLRIRERLEQRPELELLTLPEELRKDVKAREEIINEADIAFFCLPDAAAVESAALVHGNTAVIDTSTAHRTAAGWTYGFPELHGLREKIRNSRRIANPGCHASGFISLTEPLVHEGLISPDTLLSCFSVTGYSGGGKSMIAAYEAADRAAELDAPRQYGLLQSHKHLPEMAKVCGLDFAPCFSPIVVPHLSGMEVTVQMHGVDVDAVRKCYRNCYHDDGLVRFVEDPAAAEGGFLSSAAFSGRDDMEVSVCGNADRAVLVSRFDNLGKGASGAAIQNMNIVLGCAESEGLVR